jgi:hypothetical protein
MLFLMGLAIIVGVLRLDSYRPILISLIAIWVCSWFAFMIWNALQYNYVPCPRCRSNIFLRKSIIPMMVFNIPSVCPNCGLDLEHPYSPENTPTKQSVRAQAN